MSDIQNWGELCAYLEDPEWWEVQIAKGLCPECPMDPDPVGPGDTLCRACRSHRELQKEGPVPF